MQCKDEIVYKGINAKVVLTRKDFENPEEFEKWILWMRKNAYNSGLGRSVRLRGDMSFVADSADQYALIDEDEPHLWQIARQNLTETQYRRLYMYIVDELTLQAIADEEETCFQAIHKSIAGAKKKLRIILEGEKHRS